MAKLKTVYVVEADISHLEIVVGLFDLYRQFYDQNSDIEQSKRFIQERLENKDSTILLAFSAEQPIGFTQLYPAFSSVAMKPMLILNDLFVDAASRKIGAGKALLDAAYEFGESVGAGSLKLATAIDNETAKSLYESSGYEKVTAFDHYVKKID